jgi:predicted TIM-barrel fold metal-dependent hydrolase
MKMHLIDERIEAMDYAGVDKTILTMAQFGNIAGYEFCRQINEAYAELMVTHGDRFLMAGCVPVEDTEKAVAEIDYQIKELKFCGIGLLSSHSADLTMSTKDVMFPIFEKCIELDIPIFMHPHLKPYGQELECTINRSVGRGIDTMKAALRIIYDVFPTFPTLKVVLPHFGGALLAMKGRIMNFFEPPAELGLADNPQYKELAKTPLELQELGYVEAFDNLFDKLYIDGAGSGGWEPITEMAFRTVKHDKLIWGTDYPYEIHAGRDIKYYIDSLDNMDISKEDKKAFLGGNVAKLIKLDI